MFEYTGTNAHRTVAHYAFALHIQHPLYNIFSHSISFFIDFFPFFVHINKQLCKNEVIFILKSVKLQNNELHSICFSNKKKSKPKSKKMESVEGIESTHNFIWHHFDTCAQERTIMTNKSHCSWKWVMKQFQLAHSYCSLTLFHVCGVFVNNNNTLSLLCCAQVTYIRRIWYWL